MPSIELVDIWRRFGEHDVLAGATVRQVGPGVAGVVGANGAGKTTLLRIAAQLVVPDSGRVAVCGVLVEESDTAAARALVGWAPHEPLAWSQESVRANLRYAARLAGETRRRAAVHADAAVDSWALGDVAATCVGQLSRGWAQRYSLARADLLDPAVLLLDEPTTALDAAGRALLDRHLATWAGSRAVLVASHERGWLERVASSPLVELAASSSPAAPAGVRA